MGNSVIGLSVGLLIGSAATLLLPNKHNRSSLDEKAITLLARADNAHDFRPQPFTGNLAACVTAAKVLVAKHPAMDAICEFRDGETVAATMISAQTLKR